MLVGSPFMKRRIMARAGQGEILVSEITRTVSLASGLVFEDRGIHPLKGLPGEWRLFAYVEDPQTRPR
jgi:class 3 adenylate cyclase